MGKRSKKKSILIKDMQHILKMNDSYEDTIDTVAVIHKHTYDNSSSNDDSNNEANINNNTTSITTTTMEKNDNELLNQSIITDLPSVNPTNPFGSTSPSTKPKEDEEV